jgi:CheY-like chemotaxis protein
MVTVSPEPLALVVDPDAERRAVYSLILAPMASAIEFAADGRQALAMAIGHQPRFVVTEAHLAFIDGYTLCSLLRADPLTADVPIVVVTGDSDADGPERARAAGADSVLVKPCEPDALLHAVAVGRDRCRIPQEHLRAAQIPATSEQATLDGSMEPSAGRLSRSLIRAHRRFETSTPPLAPPPLVCPSCDQPLQYVRSHVGGVSARLSEQWDYYTCHNACGIFQYRQRTRRVRLVE